MRAFHRWFGFASALFMIFIATTGLGLQMDLWLSGAAPPRKAPAAAQPPAPIPPADHEVAEMVVRSLAAARAAQPDLAISSVELRFIGADVRATLGASAAGEAVIVNARTGEVAPQPPPRQDYHYFLQDLHAGYFAGTAGRIVSCLVAVSLLALGITGLVVYLDLFLRRIRFGKLSPFW